MPRKPSMTMEEYMGAAVRTAAPLRGSRDKVFRGVLGVNAEAGELANYIKKVEYQQQELDVNRVIEELGDILWYIAVLAADLDTSLGYVARANIRKLHERYPNGFRPLQT